MKRESSHRVRSDEALAQDVRELRRCNRACRRVATFRDARPPLVALRSDANRLALIARVDRRIRLRRIVRDRAHGAARLIAHRDLRKHDALHHQRRIAQRIGLIQHAPIAVAIDDGGIANADHLDRGNRARFAAREARLTPRERQVLSFVIQGVYNKNIADRIGLSIKTVELYRARGMGKLQARSVAELTRMMVTRQA